VLESTAHNLLDTFSKFIYFNFVFYFFAVFTVVSFKDNFMQWKSLMMIITNYVI